MRGSGYYDEDQAARMLSALIACRPEDRLDTLAVVAKIFLEGYLDEKAQEGRPEETRDRTRLFTARPVREEEVVSP